MKKTLKTRRVILGRVSTATRAVIIGPRLEIGSQTLHYPF